MFPHVPLQAITLDLADTRSISLTVEHILNNAIYIPETGTTGISQPLNSPTAHMSTPVTSSQSPESQSPESQAPLTDVGGETTLGSRTDLEQSIVRRRHRRERTTHHESDVTSELIRDNQSGVSPPEEALVAAQPCHEGDQEEDSMAFSSLQRRKRELLANAKRSVHVLYVCPLLFGQLICS